MPKPSTAMLDNNWLAGYCQKVLVAGALVCLLGVVLGAGGQPAGRWGELLAGRAHAQSTITLRSMVRVPADTPLTLETVSMLSGEEALALAHVELVPPGQHRTRITIEDVRVALKANGQINWGRLSLAGNECRVVTIAPPPAPKNPTHTEFETPTPIQSGEPTVRDAVVARIVALFAVTPDRLRIEFEDRAASVELLDIPTEGRTINVRAIGMSDRLPLAVTVYENHWIVARGIVRADVRLRRDVLVPLDTLQRGTTLSAEHLKVESRWTAPSDKLATAEQAIGALLRARVTSDHPLSLQDVQQPIAIKRGDHTVVHCLSGGIIMKLRARALQDGRVGDEIEFTGLDGRKGRVFMARVDSPGVAIIAAEPTDLPTSLTTTIPFGDAP